MLMLDLVFKEDQNKNEELIHDNDKLIDLLYHRIRRF